MDLKQLQAMGAFVPRTLFKCDIAVRYRPLKPTEEWADPGEPERQEEIVEETITTWVRKKSSADSIEIFQADERERPLVAVYRCICNADGSPLFESLDQVHQLEDWLILPLIIEVNKVNHFAAKKSVPKTSSGVSSRSPSAAGRLRNGKKR
ncbi:phage tail assembly chaperone family protein, TAC [Lysobacter sp. 5GHs7-4]|uniref:phage tail assembly chaperone family protein, TAC n=1 Tax=Lysobacter sp. 5GHs7-4 TaxID=2904253 RepID=UPI001E4A2557|nr:phage tail assembly chaperone family protein, TAC [Lysobacter sp. 5GHs7-4]UHQ21885.1 phage tail assembly chaperone family protein, TAC [Lysobacter sp. 5GHs7-4]